MALGGFCGDVASDDYAYTSQYEDLAMLFEASMMAYFFGVEHEIGFVEPQFDDAYYCDEFTVSWGVINRIGNPLVKERARFVASALLEGEDLSLFFDELPAAQSRGRDWCIYDFASSLSATATVPVKQAVRPDDFRRPYH